MTFKTFKEARAFARSLNLESVVAWHIYSSGEDRPNDIPKSPNVVYRKDWVSWVDFLGLKTKSRFKQKRHIYMPFPCARAYVSGLKIKTTREWYRYCTGSTKHKDIPSSPNIVYADEWVSWMDWLGTSNINYIAYHKALRSFKDARKFVKQLGLSSRGDWFEYAKSGKKPDDIPTSPLQTYRDQWVSWDHWLGKTL